MLENTFKKITVRDVQMIQLEMLKVIASLCDKHGIRYYLAAGTLLGAVRHHGFIPWDDDLDIQLPRSDYNRLLKVLLDGDVLPDSMEYSYLDKDNHFLPFLKIHYKDSLAIEKKYEKHYRESKIWIDVFPLDGLPKSSTAIKINYFIVKQLRNFLYTGVVDPCLVHGIERFATRILKPLARTIGVKNIARYIDTFSQRYDLEKSEVVGNLEWARNPGDALPKNLYLPLVDLDFEDTKFHCPKGYHEHLSRMYGDYMTPPPENKRTVHSGDFYQIVREQ